MPPPSLKSDRFFDLQVKVLAMFEVARQGEDRQLEWDLKSMSEKLGHHAMLAKRAEMNVMHEVMTGQEPLPF